jgi:hypothetical protein
MRSDNEYGVVDFHGDALFFHLLIQPRISLSLIEIQVRGGDFRENGPGCQFRKMGALDTQVSFSYTPAHKNQFLIRQAPGCSIAYLFITPSVSPDGANYCGKDNQEVQVNNNDSQNIISI